MAKQEKRLTEFLKSHFHKKWNWLKKQWDCLKNCFYKHRVLSFRILYLVIAFLFGLGLSSLGIWWIHHICFNSDFVYKASKKLLTERNWLIITGLPVAFCLWLFRTKDRKDQIEKTQENIQASLLSNSLTLLASDDPKARKVGLVQLLQLRNKERVYKDQIDIATPGTNLQKAHLVKADLRNAQLQDADLEGAYLQNTDLQDADLRGANLQNTDLRDTVLKGANLKGAYLGGSQLKNKYLRGFNLQGTKLQRADLRRANLQEANLEGACLEKTNLQGADLQSADLRNAYLRDANLRGADVNGKTKFEGAQYDKQTIFPNDFGPKKHGMRFNN